MDGTCKKVKASILYYCSVGCIFKTDLVSRSVLKMKRGEGGGGRVRRETRKRDLAKYESKRALIGCSIMHAKAPRTCLPFQK